MFQKNAEKQHFECLKLEFQEKIRVFKSRFVSGWGKNPRGNQVLKTQVP